MDYLLGQILLCLLLAAAIGALAATLIVSRHQRRQYDDSRRIWLETLAVKDRELGELLRQTHSYKHRLEVLDAETQTSRQQTPQSGAEPMAHPG